VSASILKVHMAWSASLAWRPPVDGALIRAA
jgi:hypothetical protein